MQRLQGQGATDGKTHTISIRGMLLTYILHPVQSAGTQLILDPKALVTCAICACTLWHMGQRKMQCSSSTLHIMLAALGTCLFNLNKIKAA